MKRLSFCLLFFWFCLLAHGTNYYFSTSTGIDTRSNVEASNPNTPWKSLSKLNSYFPSLNAGDSVLFKCGETFYGSFTAGKSGSPSAPIVLASYGSGAKPIISGFTQVTSWTALGNGIYESNVLPAGTKVNMVTINGNAFAMGRYPNANAGNGGYLNFESHGSNSITDNEKPGLLDASWVHAELVVRVRRFTMEHGTINSISGNTIAYGPSFESTPIDHFGYFVQNSIKTLDQFGEWYYNDTTHKIDMYFGNTSPSSKTVMVSTIDVIATSNNSNMAFINLSFQGANSNAVYGDWAGLSNLKMTGCDVSFNGICGVTLAGRTNFYMDNCTVLYNNVMGVNLFYNNVTPTILRSTIDHTTTFAGMIRREPNSHLYGNGIYSTSGLTAMYNNITNSGFIGINTTGDNNLIQYNFINNYCSVLDDGAGLYCYTGSSSTIYANRRFYNNVIINGIGAPNGVYTSDPNDPYVFSVYLDDWSTYNDIQFNTMAHNTGGGIKVHNSNHFTIRNNKVFDNYIGILMQHDNSTANAITDGVVKRNRIFALKANQYILSLASGFDDIANFAVIDSNRNCSPFNEAGGLYHTNYFGHDEHFFNLADWRQNFSFDLKTKQTPLAVSDESDIVFKYATGAKKLVRFCQSVVDVDSTTVNKIDSIPSYNSNIFIKPPILQ